MTTTNTTTTGDAPMTTEITVTKSKNRAPKQLTAPVDAEVVLPPAPIDDSRAVRARAEIRALADSLKARFLERDDVVDGLLSAAVAGEHVLMLGPPGTAKSELTSAFCTSLGGKFFDTLCHRHQTHDEFFGPLSLRAMQNDQLVRATGNRLPEADIAFFDEVYKGSSTLLNTLLRAINERTFEQDGKRVTMPLRLIVAASNELPDDGDGLGAFHDRFLVRFEVKSLQDNANARTVIFDEGPDHGPIPMLDPRVLDYLAELAADVVASEDAVLAVLKIREDLRDAQVQVSDRRWRKAAKLMRAEAVIAGRPRVTSAQLGILEHVLWERPEQIPTVQTIVRKHLATWMAATKTAHAALDEQLARIADAARSTTTKRFEVIGALAKCLDALVEIDGGMKTLLSEHPEADVEVEKVRARITKAKADVNVAMRTLGIGAL